MDDFKRTIKKKKILLGFSTNTGSILRLVENIGAYLCTIFFSKTNSVCCPKRLQPEMTLHLQSWWINHPASKYEVFYVLFTSLSHVTKFVSFFSKVSICYYKIRSHHKIKDNSLISAFCPKPYPVSILTIYNWRPLISFKVLRMKYY